MPNKSLDFRYSADNLAEISAILPFPIVVMVIDLYPYDRTYFRRLIIVKTRIKFSC